MRRGVLIMLLRLGGSVIFVFGFGSLGRSGWEIMVDDRLVIDLSREEIRSRSLCSGLERMVFVLVGTGVLILVGRTTLVGATVANTCLTAEIEGPAFRQLRAWDVGLEDLVDGSIV